MNHMQNEIALKGPKWTGFENQNQKNSISTIA